MDFPGIKPPAKPTSTSSIKPKVEKKAIKFMDDEYPALDLGVKGKFMQIFSKRFERLTEFIAVPAKTRPMKKSRVISRSVVDSETGAKLLHSDAESGSEWETEAEDDDDKEKELEDAAITETETVVVLARLL